MNKIFSDYNKFKSEIRIVFREIDKVHTAEQEIFHLWQKGAAATYVTTFQRLTAATEWEDLALTAQYYKGLNDKVKDKITCGKHSDTLHKMIKQAIVIDNQVYE